MAVTPWSLLKGLTTAADHMTCPPGFLMQMDDWLIDYGRLRPRFGSTQVNSSPNPLVASGGVDCGIFYKDVNAPTNGGVMIVQVVGKIYRSAQYSGDGQFLTHQNVAFTDITGTATPSTGAVGGMMDVLNNILIITSTSGAPSQVTSDSSNAAPLAGSPPSGMFVKVVNNFAFLAGVKNGGTNSSRLWWSNVGDPQTWTAANFLDWRTNDADFIAGLGSVGQDLFVFKTNNIGRLSTQTLTISGNVTLGPMTTLFKGLGIAGYRCVDNLPTGEMVFLGSDWNLYVCDGISMELLSRGPFGQPNVFINGYSKGLLSYAQAGLYLSTGLASLTVHPGKNEIWISVTVGSNVPGVIFVYDYVQQYWRKITGHNIGPFWKFTPTRGTSAFLNGQYPYRIFGGTNGDRTNTQIIALDNETITNPSDDFISPITANAVFSVSDPELLGKMASIDVPSSNSGTTTVTFGFDGTLNGSSTASLSSTTIRNAIKIPYRSPTASVRPSSLQVQLKDTNSANLVYTPYFSDEVLT